MIFIKPATNDLEIATLLHKLHSYTNQCPGIMKNPYKRSELSHSANGKKTKVKRRNFDERCSYSMGVNVSVKPWRWHSERGIFIIIAPKTSFPSSHISSAIKKAITQKQSIRRKHEIAETKSIKRNGKVLEH